MLFLKRSSKEEGVLRASSQWMLMFTKVHKLHSLLLTILTSSQYGFGCVMFLLFLFFQLISVHDCVHNPCGYKSLLPGICAVLQTLTFPASTSWISSLPLKATVQNAVSLSCAGIAGSVRGSRSSLVILSSLCTVVCLSAEPVMTQTRNADAVWHFIPPGRVRLSAACVNADLQRSRWLSLWALRFEIWRVQIWLKRGFFFDEHGVRNEEERI